MVAEATRDAVLDAVAAVGFVPNRSARQLVSGRADAIGVLVPDITNPYFATIAQAIQGDARGADLAVLMADTGAEADEELRALAALSRRVDGIIAVTPVTDLAAATVPVVQVNRSSRGVASVVVDQAAIARLGLEHLHEQGHTRLGVLRGPTAYWSASRRDRAIQQLQSSDHFADTTIELLGPAPATFEGGVAAFDLIERSGITGVMAFNDLQAAGLLVAAHRSGRTVPDDLSVVGSDGLSMAAMTSPALTTVAAPLEALGRTARLRLDELLAGSAESMLTTLQPELATGSSAAAPSRRRSRDSGGNQRHVHTT